MEKGLNFIIDNWAYIVPVILWVAQRLIKTQKNYDLLEMFIKFLGEKVIPNRRKDVVSLPTNQLDLELDSKESKKKEGANVGRKLVTLLCLLAFPFLSVAQNNGNFKSVRFVNVLDSTTVLPINATIYYNEQSNKFRAYENGTWKDLISSGGSTYTASNGLTLSGSDFKLGGALTQSTNITGSQNLFFNLNSGGTNALILSKSGVGAINIGGFGNPFTITDNRSGTSQGGIKYTADYSANYTDRSLPDWGSVWRTTDDTNIDFPIDVLANGGDVRLIGNTDFISNFGGVIIGGSTDSGLSLTNYLQFAGSDVSFSIGGSTGVSTQFIGSNGFGGLTWAVPSSTLPSSYIGFGNGSNVMTGEAALSYNSTLNEIVLADPTSNFTTSIFGGEIQLDDIVGSDDLTLNDSGITATGNTEFFVSNQSGDLTLDVPSGSEINIGLATTAGNRIIQAQSSTSNANITLNAQNNGIATVSGGGVSLVSGSGGNIALATGGGITITTGANAPTGTAILVGGTVTVNTTRISASSQVFLTGQNSSGTHGELTISARTPGVSFTITSSSATDTRTVAYFIVN